MKILGTAFKEAEKLAAHTGSTLEEAQQMQNEKEEFLQFAKQRLQALKNERASAQVDMEKTREAEANAIQAAKTAHENAERNRRKTQQLI